MGRDVLAPGAHHPWLCSHCRTPHMCLIHCCSPVSICGCAGLARVPMRRPWAPRGGALPPGATGGGRGRAARRRQRPAAAPARCGHRGVRAVACAARSVAERAGAALTQPAAIRAAALSAEQRSSGGWGRRCSLRCRVCRSHSTGASARPLCVSWRTWQGRAAGCCAWMH